VIWSSCWGEPPKIVSTSGICIQILHADYERVKERYNFEYVKKSPTTHYVSVSELVREKFKKVYGIDSTVIYNILDFVHYEKPLKLITLSRVTDEKGFDNVVKMAKQLKEYGKPFSWKIYGKSQDVIDRNYANKIIDELYPISEVTFQTPQRKLTNELFEADYLVHLSKSEGNAYAVSEALQTNTPCIITDFESGKEQVTDGENGYILKQDLSNLDIDKIFNKIPKFEYVEQATPDDWIKYISSLKTPIKPLVKSSLNSYVKVCILYSYIDLERQERMQIGDVIEVNHERAKILIEKGAVKYE
jgi:glycosyltransferase involved in cell wall biosynthesis